MSIELIGENENGVPFASRIVKKGDKYGRDFCLVHDCENALVEFWDLRHEHDLIEPNGETKGQFVSRYYVKTLTGGCDYSNGAPATERGVNLDGGVDDWFIDAGQVRKAIDGEKLED